MGFPVLVSMIAALALSALYVLLERDAKRGRRVALGVSALVFLAALGLALAFDPSGSSRQFGELAYARGALGVPIVHLAVDGIAALFLPVGTLCCLAVLLAAPRTLMGPRAIAATLLTCAATIALQCATDLDAFAVAWLAELLPAFLAFESRGEPGRERRVRRVYAVYVVGGSLPLLLGAVLLHAFTHQTVDLDRLSLAHHGPSLSLAQTELLCGLFLISMFARKGLFPLHSWLPLMVAEGPVGVVVQLLGAHASLMLLVRVVAPLLPSGGGTAMALLGAAGIFSAVYAALVAIGQRDLRYATGYVAMAQSSLIFAGAATMTEQSLAGALLMCVGFSVAITGLVTLVRGLRARTGTTDVGMLGGLVARAPVMTAMFLIFATTLCAIPGSIGFVAEDLLIHGVLHHHPWMAALMLFAGALNAITLFRAFSHTFLGRPRMRPRTAGPAPIADLLPREKVAAFSLALVLLVGGVTPALLLRYHGTEVHAMVAHEHAAHD